MDCRATPSPPNIVFPLYLDNGWSDFQTEGTVGKHVKNANDWNPNPPAGKLSLLKTSGQSFVTIYNVNNHMLCALVDKIENQRNCACFAGRRWYDDETTMVRWWNNDGETTMARWWNNDGETTMVRWWNRDITSRFHHRTIVPSCFHHRVIVVSPSCLRVYVIVLSYHRDFTIVQSCIAVKWEKTI